MKSLLVSIGVLIGILIIIFFIIFFGLGFFISPQSDPVSKADAIVVVSGGQTTTRAEKGIILFKQGLASKIIFSGAALDDGPSNATAMREQALSAGIPSKDIEVDSDSQNTYQNALNTKKILENIGAHSLILVTSPYHQKRANDTFSHVLGPDYKIENVSSFDNRWSKSGWWSTRFGLNISLSELQKLLYINITGNYQ
ncbi:MAG: YdcF family protein [Candidatus Saccharibacteria bacterium]